MDTAKIKNFIIILLLLVNLFLLAIVIVDSSAAARAAAAAEAYTAQVLSQNGISMGADVDLGTAAPHTVTLRRDLDAERHAVTRLLGKVSTEDQGGNIIYYRGENGEASFRGTGEFDISLAHGAVETGADPVQTAKSVLTKLGMGVMSAASLEPVTLNSGESFTLTLTCAWQSDAIFNSRVTFTFTSESLLLVSGHRVMDTVSSRSEEKPLDAPTVLMRFLDLIRSEGYICTELRSMTPGYAMSVSVSGDGTLYPVWRIETDAGEYYLNGLTGRTEPIAY